MSQNVILSNPQLKSNLVIDLPSSKSISNRVLIISALSKKKANLLNLSDSDDTIVLKNALEEDKDEYNFGHSGTSVRFFIAYCCLTGRNCKITGSDRMKNRPIQPLIDALKKLGASIRYLEKEGYLPIEIQSSILKGDTVELDVTVSSQYCSALMLIAPYLKNGLTIHLKGTLVSEPYIKMTNQLMKKAGIEVLLKSQSIFIPPGEYNIDKIYIEKDWSSAAFWYGWVALSPIDSCLLLDSLQISGLQGDEKVKEYFQLFGVITLEQDNGILIQKTSNDYQEFIEINLIDSPDLAPIIATTMAGLKIKGKLTGLQTLNLKESKRIEVLKMELEKTGAMIISNDDFLEIKSYTNFFPDIYFKTYEDHRMAMAFSSLVCKFHKITIENYPVVTKSYPEYWENVKKCCSLNFQ